MPNSSPPFPSKDKRAAAAFSAPPFRDREWGLGGSGAYRISWGVDGAKEEEGVSAESLNGAPQDLQAGRFICIRPHLGHRTPIFMILLPRTSFSALMSSRTDFRTAWNVFKMFRLFSDFLEKNHAGAGEPSGIGKFTDNLWRISCIFSDRTKSFQTLVS